MPTPNTRPRAAAGAGGKTDSTRKPAETHDLLNYRLAERLDQEELATGLAARLNHPNILPVVDAGHDERYGDYLVTPRLETRSLQAQLANGPLDPLLALRIFSQIGGAIDYLHAQGVVHRDVQPAN